MTDMNAYEQSWQIKDVAEMKNTAKRMEESLARLDQTFSRIADTLSSIEKKLDKLLPQ